MAIMESIEILSSLLENYIYLVPVAVILLFFLGARNQLEIPRVGGSPQRLLVLKATHRWLDHSLEMLEDGYRRVSGTRSEITSVALPRS